MSQDESSLGRKIDKKTLGDDSDEDESDDSSQSLNTQPRRRNPDQASVGILPLKEGTKKSKDNARHYHSKSESENGIESHLEDSKVARRAKGDLTKKSNWKGETNMRETEDIMSEDESSLGRKVGKKTLDDSNEDESDDFSQSLNTKPRRRNPDQYSIGILPLKEGTKKFKDDARHYHSESESENGIESHLEDSKVTRKAKGDLRKKSLLKGETKMTDDLSDDEEHHDFKKETKLSSLEDDGHRNYESCPKPAKTPRHHDEEGKKRGLNLELQERKITAPSSNQQTNNNVQVSDESGSDSSENNLRVRSHVQKKSDVVKKGNSNMLHQHVGSESDSDNLSGRILERQVEERALKKGSFKRSTKKNSHNKGGSDSESEQYCESEEKNKLSKKDTRDCRKMNQERYTSKKNSHNESESESDSESEQHYKSNGRKELSRKDTRDYGKMKEENNTSKRNLKKMSKYEEQNKSDSSEDKWTEKRPHSKISPKAKETHYSEVKTLSHLSDRSQSGRGREAKNHSSSRKVNAQSCSESDSDSDNYRVKEAKDPREARHGSAEKSMRKGISKEKKEYRKHEHESQSELSDGSYTDKEYSKGESYMGYGSRRGKNRSSHNDIESDPNEEQQGFHTPRAKSKHQQKGDVSKPYGRNFQEKMESIDRNLPRRQKSDAYSSLAEKERDAEDFTSKHSREKYRERNGGKSTYQQTGSESETEDQSFRNTSRGRVERPYKEDGEWTNSDSFKHKKRAHGKYKDPNSENQHLKNMNEGKREDTGQNVDYENDGAGYSPQRNFQRREDRYEERWSQEYHHKHGRGKEPKGNQFQMAERRVYRRQPGFNYDNAKDDRKEDYRRKKWDVCISDEEDVSENEPSLRHQPDRPGHLFQYRNLAKQRGSDENARPRISNIRGRPVRFSSDDEEEYVPPRTPRKQKTDQNPPNLYDTDDDNRRGGQKSPDVNQGFCRRRNYSLRDRHDDFSFPKDLPRQRNLFPREAPVYQKPQRIQRRVRGPQSMSDISMREDPRNHNVQAHDFPSDEDDDYAGYEEIRGQKHKFSGPRREHPDNPRLVKMSQRLRDASQESEERNEGENREKEQKESDGNKESVNVEGSKSNEGSSKRDDEGSESNGEKGESDDEGRESIGEKGESDDEESESYDDVTEGDDERESDDEEPGNDDANRKSAQGERESDEERENDDAETTAVAGEVEGRTRSLDGAGKLECRVPHAGRRIRMGFGNVASEQVLEMNQGPRSLPSFPPEDDGGSLRQHHKRSSRSRRRHDIFPDESYLEYQSLNYSSASGYNNKYHQGDEQFQTLSPQLLVDVLIKCPDYCSTLLYFVEKFDFRPSHIRKVVSENSHVFVLDKEAIILQPKIELCTSHLSLSGCSLRLECDNIHVCPRFITSRCYEENCLFGHKFKTTNNLRKLRNYYLDHLSSSSLKQFFRSSASTETHGLIEICKDYNKGKCMEKNCLALHICSDYIANRLTCTNRQCQLNHNLLSSETCWLLGRHGIDTNETPRDIFAVLLEINPTLGETERSNTEVSGTNASHQTSNEVSRQNFEFFTGGHSARSSSPLPAVPLSGMEESAENSGNIAVSVSTTALSDTSVQDHITAIINVLPDTNTEPDSVSQSSVVCNSDVNESSGIVTQVSNNLVSRVSCTKELKVNIPSLWSHNLEGDVRVAEICYDSVVGSCPREQHSCARLHSTRHFHWQVSEENYSWLNLQPFQVMCLERSFCNPALDSVSLPPLDKSELEPSKAFLLLLMGEDVWTANFQGMVMLNSDETRILYLRRLCTEIIPGITINPSIYHWFICDDDGVWTEYGENEDGEEDGYINSEVLEYQYMINPNAYAQFTLSDGEYNLDFSTMTQTSLSTQEVHNVRRRPKPHLPERAHLFDVLEGSDSDEEE
ncbi:dentin sialophosphoprotein-like isoform X3 [Macrobrachium rosenbergii]|uniref:dentin sialophosphoprotein-like isoform X3 n=1 Tax=Macrobrachium rosenbergii TaxID=79674 RepID=UPI0034D58A46